MRKRKRLLGLLALVAVIVALLPLGASAAASDKGEEGDQVDYCDPSQKPSGSIGKWLADNGIDPSEECFDWSMEEACGMLDVTLTRNETPYGYLFLWNEGAAPNLGAADSFPAEFVEDYNGGSVEITFYVAGPEGDYFKGFGIPNFWDGGQTITIDTDCEDPLPAFEIEVGQSCGMVFGEVTENNTNFAAFISGVEGSESPLLNDHPWGSLNAFGVDTAGKLEHSFPEDYNGGSVTVTLFAHGPEQDVYAVDGRSPIFEVLTIDTDCEEEVTTTTTTLPTTTTTTTPEETTTTTVEETTTTTDADSTTTAPTTEETLPFTGIEDFYLPTAIALVAAGGLLLALSRRPEEDVA